MMSQRPLIALIAIALAASACGGEATSPTPVETPKCQGVHETPLPVSLGGNL